MSGAPRDPIPTLLTGVRRRLRLAWAVATAAILLPFGAGLALLAAAAGRLRPLEWADPLALTLLGAVVFSVAVAALVVRIPQRVAARAADRGLGTGDAFATTLEVTDGPMAEHVTRRARALAAGRSAADAVPLRADPRRWALGAALTAVALALAFVPNAQDAVRAQREAERAALAEEAERLAEAARDLQRIPDATEGEEQVAERLAELARELAQAPDLEAGEQAIDRAATELGDQLDSDLLAQKAAVQGLEKTLDAQPLPETDGSAAEQLEELAGVLDKLSPEQQQELAERLGELAGSQTAGNPEAAGALQRAASELQAGDLGEAAEALEGAAQAQAGAAEDLAGQQTAAEAMGALGQARGRLGEQGEGGSGETPGSTESEGSQGGSESGSEGSQGSQGSQGSERSGSQGSQGSGSQGSQGSGSQGSQGSGTGSASPSGGGSGQGTGPGELGRTEIVTPELDGDSERVDVEGEGPDGEGEILGRATGPTGRGLARTPLNRAYPRYREQATRTLDTLDIPPSVRSLVRSYFDSLGDL